MLSTLHVFLIVYFTISLGISFLLLSEALFIFRNIKRFKTKDVIKVAETRLAWCKKEAILSPIWPVRLIVNAIQLFIKKS
jgi:hypothetical protein